MKRGEEAVLTLEGFAFEGKSVARLDGLVVFVFGAVPGDTARVRFTKVKKSFCEAQTLEVLTPSPLRTAPRCRYFGVCGGCRWQNVRYDAQQDFKRQNVVDALERIGGFRGVPVNPTLGANDDVFYRNKMEFSFGQRWLAKEEMESKNQDVSLFALGLHIPDRFDRVLDLEECWLQSETSVRIVNAVRRFCLDRRLSVFSTATHTGYLRNLVIREGKRTGELMVNLVTRDDRPDVMQELRDTLLASFPGMTTLCNNITERKSQVAVGDREVIYHGPGYITERIGKRIYRISANSFFQTNTIQAERLYDTVLRMARIRTREVVYDLYSGTGTIALHIADDAARVIGIESLPAAVNDARNNAAANGVENCTFVLGDLRETLTKRTESLAPFGTPDVVIVDPPRAGMHEDVVRRVVEGKPERIVYVSCNPATQARDLKLMGDEYTIREVQPVDMFPHTFHVESVVLLSR